MFFFGPCYCFLSWSLLKEIWSHRWRKYERMTFCEYQMYWHTIVSGHTDYWNVTMFWSLWFVDLLPSVSNQESYGTCLGSHPWPGEELFQAWIWEDTGKESGVVLATYGFCFFAVFCEAYMREASLSWSHWIPTLNWHAMGRAEHVWEHQVPPLHSG